MLEKEIGGTLVPARFDLMIYADSPSFGTVAEIIKESWRKIGVEAIISPTKWALMLQRLNNREFEACMLGWGSSWKEDPFQLWHGSQADEPYSSNYVSYRNPRVDALIDQLRITLDEKRQIPLYHEIDRLIYEDQPYTFLFAEDATSGYNVRLDNVRFTVSRPVSTSPSGGCWPTMREWPVVSGQWPVASGHWLTQDHKPLTTNH